MGSVKTYYIAEVEICFGFGGFKRAAYATEAEAEAAVAAYKATSVTGRRVYAVEAKNKTEAIRNAANGRSMFTGEFAGADNATL